MYLLSVLLVRNDSVSYDSSINPNKWFLSSGASPEKIRIDSSNAPQDARRSSQYSPGRYSSRETGCANPNREKPCGVLSVVGVACFNGACRSSQALKKMLLHNGAPPSRPMVDLSVTVTIDFAAASSENPEYSERSIIAMACECEPEAKIFLCLRPARYRD